MLISGSTQGDANVLKINSLLKYNNTNVQEWVPFHQGPRRHLLSRQMTHLFINSPGSNGLPEIKSSYNQFQPTPRTNIWRQH